MRKKILVDIYLAYNLGDDMFLDYLATSYPDYDFVPYHPGKNYTSFFSKYNNIEQFPYSLYDKIVRKLGYDKLSDYDKFASSCDGLLFLGGGIFREEFYWETVYQYRQNIIEAFIKNDKKVWFMGGNFGPYNTEDFRFKYESLFSTVSKINFRDKKSYSLFSSLDNVDYFPDILWSYQLPSVQSNNKQLGISVINPKHKEGQSHFYDDYIEAHASVISRYLDEGYSVKLFSFCEAEGDLEICTELKRQYSNVDVINYSGNITDYLKKIGECSYFIAARFHANIIAIKYGIPLIPIIYGDKTENLLDDLGYIGTKIYLKNIKEVNSQQFVDFPKDTVLPIIIQSKKHLDLSFKIKI